MNIKFSSGEVFSADSAISVFDAAKELAEKGFSISQTRYEMDKGTSLELTNSQVSLTNAKLSLKNTIYEYLIAKTDLEKVLGISEYVENK